MKYVIQTLKSTNECLNTLLESIKNFENPISMNDIIIVKCNMPEDKIYNFGYTYIETCEYNFELSSLNMIKKYLHNTYVNDDFYLFFTDQCEILPEFPGNIKQYTLENSVYIPYKPCKHVMVINSKVLEKMNYYDNISYTDYINIDTGLIVRNHKHVSYYARHIIYVDPMMEINCESNSKTFSYKYFGLLRHEGVKPVPIQKAHTSQEEVKSYFANKTGPTHQKKKKRVKYKKHKNVKAIEDTESKETEKNGTNEDKTQLPEKTSVEN